MVTAVVSSAAHNLARRFCLPRPGGAPRAAAALAAPTGATVPFSTHPPVIATIRVDPLVEKVLARHLLRHGGRPMTTVTASGGGGGGGGSGGSRTDSASKALPAWSASSGQPPPEPSNCCGVGCVDCVWISHWERMNEFDAWSRAQQGRPQATAPAYAVPKPAVGGAGRGASAGAVYGQARRLTGSSSGYKSARD
jgi:hypothetical protein